MKSAVLVLALVWSLAGGAWAQEEEGRARLIVTCDQPRALVFIDRALVGTAPVDAELSPGQHEVRVSIDASWFPFKQTVVLEAGHYTWLKALLARSSEGLYRDGLAAYQKGDLPAARNSFNQAVHAPGKLVPESYFYLGLLAEQAGDTAGGIFDFSTFLHYKDGSPAGHYHLGRCREAMGEPGKSASSYKLGLLRVDPQLQNVIAAAPQPTTSEIDRLRQAPDATSRLQLAYLLELKGSLDEARALYRSLLETAALDHNFDLNAPPPLAVPPEPAPGPQPEDDPSTMEKEP